ncbi:porin family protein [Dyadobacter sp. NIV53]|uniref:porin family protein n=1 Tax=Dyadobacter sp. NIV53 TaxID=2861765 RepID=UPI001C8432EF|nr:porin family protein [Dyadobacter sp. NIV53]
MKKIAVSVLILLVLTLATKSFAQTFSLRSGLNLSTMQFKDDQNESDILKLKPGFHVDALVEFPIAKNFSFETGLLFSMKGTRIDEKLEAGNVTYHLKTRTTLMYLDIPLNAKTIFSVGQIKVYGTLGPYVGIGLAGKNKIEETINGEKTTENVDAKWGKDGDLKRLDFGLAVGAGVEINALLIGVNYGYGLANISSYTDGGLKMKNRVLGISIGYKFAKK